MKTPLRACLSLLALHLLASPLVAANLDLQGTVGYEPRTDGRITLNVDRVQNNSSGGRSGTIRLQLWATSSAYSGGSISGYELADYRFSSTLNGGSYFYNVSQTVDVDDPPDGSYYLVMLLLEWDGSEYVIRDYTTFSTRKDFGLDLEGAYGFSTSGSQATIEAGAVRNSRWGGSTGSLKLSVWATSSRYSGGTIQGYIVAEYQFSSTLSPQHRFSNIDRTVSLDRPPDGTYYMTMTLMEYTGGQYRIKDYHTFSERMTFGGSSGGGGGGGGGGSGTQPGFNGNGTTVGTFGYMAPYSGPNWFYDNALGAVFAQGGSPWIWSTDLNEWIYLGTGRAQTRSLGWLTSNETRGWLVSSVFGWIHFGSNYSNWIWTERFGWMWRQEDGDTLWVWTPSAGWMGFATNGSWYLWSINQGRWLPPLSTR